MRRSVPKKIILSVHIMMASLFKIFFTNLFSVAIISWVLTWIFPLTFWQAVLATYLTVFFLGFWSQIVEWAKD